MSPAHRLPERPGEFLPPWDPDPRYVELESVQLHPDPDPVTRRVLAALVAGWLIGIAVGILVVAWAVR